MGIPREHHVIGINTQSRHDLPTDQKTDEGRGRYCIRSAWIQGFGARIYHNKLSMRSLCYCSCASEGIVGMISRIFCSFICVQIFCMCATYESIIVGRLAIYTAVQMRARVQICVCVYVYIGGRDEMRYKQNLGVLESSRQRATYLLGLIKRQSFGRKRQIERGIGYWNARY